jgi:hypothetical protein
MLLALLSREYTERYPTASADLILSSARRPKLAWPIPWALNTDSVLDLRMFDEKPCDGTLTSSINVLEAVYGTKDDKGDDDDDDDDDVEVVYVALRGGCPGLKGGTKRSPLVRSVPMCKTGDNSCSISSSFSGGQP